MKKLFDKTSYIGIDEGVPNNSIFAKHLDIADRVIYILNKHKCNKHIFVNYRGTRAEQELQFHHFTLHTASGDYDCCLHIKYDCKNKSIRLEYSMDDLRIKKTVYEGDDLFDKIESLVADACNGLIADIQKKSLSAENDWNMFMIEYGDRIDQLDEKARKHGMTVYIKSKDEPGDNIKWNSLVLDSLKEKCRPFSINICPNLELSCNYESIGSQFQPKNGKFNSFEDMLKFMDILIDKIVEYDRLMEECNKFVENGEKELGQLVH